MKHILQISDPHIAKNGELISECLDTVSALRRLVVRISEVQLEVGPIDAILVSGDISDDGSAESYELFKSVLKTLNLPYSLFQEIMTSVMSLEMLSLN